jgi:putative flippase GtrA
MPQQLREYITKLFVHKFLRYAIVGVSSTLIDTLIFGVQVKMFGINPLLAKLPSQVVAITNGYYWNRRWTFESKGSNVRKQFMTFAAVNLVGVALSLLCLQVFINILGFEEILSNILTAFVILVWNFNINKLVTFK